MAPLFSCPDLVVWTVTLKLQIPAITPHSRKSVDFVILPPQDQDSSDKDFFC
jgi:hypothetical protein